STLRVPDIMRQDVKMIPRTTPLSEIVKAFLTTRSLYLYVGDEEGRLLGVVDLHDIKEQFPEREIGTVVIAEDLVTEIPCVTPSESLTSVNEKLWFRDLGHLPVVDSLENKRFLGIVTRRGPLGAVDPGGLHRGPPLAPPPPLSGGKRGGGRGHFRLAGENPRGRGRTPRRAPPRP